MGGQRATTKCGMVQLLRCWRVWGVQARREEKNKRVLLSSNRGRGRRARQGWPDGWWVEDAGMKARDSVNLKRSSSQWRSMRVTHCSVGATTSAKRPVHTERNQAMAWRRICLPSCSDAVLPTYAPVNRKNSAGPDERRWERWEVARPTGKQSDMAKRGRRLPC